MRRNKLQFSLLKGFIQGNTLYVIAIMVGFSAFGYALTGDILPSREALTTGDPVIIVTPKSESAQDNLQLKTFGYITRTPTAPLPPAQPKQPGQSCGANDDNGIPQPPNCKCDAFSDTIALNCKAGKAYKDTGKALGSKYDKFCGTPLAPSEGRYCIEKPVIYLYPLVPTLVNVQVQTAGKIVVSDPLYPVDGWKNVLAYPNGELSYQNKKYSELFYESEVTAFKKPEKGIIISAGSLKEKLNSLLDQLGLVKREKEEFLDFWVPRLQALNSPYIFFSVLDTAEKERLDKVSINPEPDTRIEFIAYFKPIAGSSSMDGSLQLPSPPKRIGFVSVEWGGSLDLSGE